jgi:uncharacterized protein (DUF302 family)
MADIKKFARYALFLTAGIVATAITAGLALPKLILTEQESPYSLEETVTRIVERTRQSGWVVPKVYDFEKSIAEHTGIVVGPVRVIEICFPDSAARMLAEDRNKVVTPFMPCAVGVYQKSDGSVYVARLNVGVMGRFFGGSIQSVMTEIAARDDALLAFLDATE